MTSVLALPAGALPGGTVPPPPHSLRPPLRFSGLAWGHLAPGPRWRGGHVAGCVCVPPPPPPAAALSEQMGRARGYI